MLKMDRFLADANWDMVEKYTFIINPYHKKDTDDKVLMIDEFLYPSMLYSNCPECHSRVFNEPTPKEHFEMANDARVRYLKTEKVSTNLVSMCFPFSDRIVIKIGSLPESELIVSMDQTLLIGSR